MYVLTQLAHHLGVEGEEVTLTKTLIDPRVQWSAAKNIWNNAGIRTMFYVAGTPFRWVRASLRRSET